MDVSLWAALLGIIAGSFGYWFTTFCMQPIIRYRDLRNQVLMNFIYYAQVVNAEGLNEEIKDMYRQRVHANRKLSAQLSASIMDLPWWYLAYQKIRKLNPKDGAKHLIGYSNTTEYDQAEKVENAIRRKLGLPKQT